MGIHSDYAQSYSVSLARAISDRDWPMSEAECVEVFVEESGRQPTPTEVVEMRPDSPEVVDEIIADLDRDSNC